MTARLAWLRSRTTMPLTVLEWSQSKAATAWLAQPADPRFGSASNRDVIEREHTDRMTPSAWQAFVATAPADPSFMPASVAEFARAQVQFAAYAPGVQYGKPAYDWVALYASKTVVGGGLNEPFASQYATL